MADFIKSIFVSIFSIEFLKNIKMFLFFSLI